MKIICLNRHRCKSVADSVVHLVVVVHLQNNEFIYVAGLNVLD